MDMRRIAISAAWSSFVRQKEWSESIAGDHYTDFDALYRQYYPRILVFLCFLVGKPEVAEDLASLVFEKALVHLADMQAPDTAGPWLFRVARNCATDYFRRCKPIVSLEQLITEEHPQAESLEAAAIASEEQRYLLAHLEQLTERVVIGLKFVAGLHNREIARVLQIPEGTVGSALYRTLRRLRAALDAEGGRDGGSS
jgi:RNA polymerase sigma factor (sigma-70 family)